MSVMPTEGVTTTGAPWTPPATGGATSGLGDQQLFLELMVTQLRYQDPLNPSDSGEFLAQTAQFTALEKMQAVADQTAMLVSTQMAFGASSLIGRSVQWADEAGVEHTGTVRGTTFLPTGPVLDVDGEQVPIFSLVSVGEAGTTTDPSDSTDSTDSTAPAAD